MPDSQRTLKVLELFAATRSIGKAFERRGHDVFSVDWDGRFEDIDLCKDVMDVTAQEVIQKFGRPDVVWMSPDCTSYSLAAISHHREKTESGNLAPKTEYAAKCDRVNLHCHNLIMTLMPKLWFIENPRGGMKSMDFMSGLPRYTITYCQYGDKRMKPTNIWTNHPNPRFRPPCKSGDPCHEAAPRGSKTGTQGLKDWVERSRIPDAFCDHVVRICEDEILGVPYDAGDSKGKLFKI